MTLSTILAATACLAVLAAVGVAMGRAQNEARIPVRIRDTRRTRR